MPDKYTIVTGHGGLYGKSREVNQIFAWKYSSKRIHRSLPKRMTPRQVESLAKLPTEVEIIYARGCISPVESAFNWSAEIKKIDLF